MSEATRGGMWPWLGALTQAAGRGEAAEADTPEGLAAALEALFAEEAQALRSAAFDRLEGLAAEKTRLAEGLAAAVPALPAAQARHLQGLAQRNAALLEAAGLGLKAAAERIGRITAPPPPLQTYDDAGRRMTMTAPGSGHRV